ncbi:hypothetical protein [Carnobacterium maltaromaticum]|uniref:hypothetical protein n=1 Tax=Carnobacterium maltaromaticum TaxID=2751 RepID=UPI00165AFBAD|nr:hypothetical protein [Carnobacterium maltaromaticum]MBC9788604.1 hypothetical protein [Carnobacterium maltaromaticum]
MAKTELTKKAEKLLYSHTDKLGTFGCFEVTIGFNGEYRGGIERVDYMTYSTKGEFRCYEIKVTEADFNSAAKVSFLGHYNYYVMPKELYEKLKGKEKQKIPWGIGVIIFSNNYYMECLKKPTKKQVSLGMGTVLMESMVRSLSRETSKFYKVKGYWED